VATDVMKMSIPTPVGPVHRKKSNAPMELRVAFTGDRRATENLILEVRAIAQRCGLEMPSVQVIRQPNVGAKTTKTKKVASHRKSRS
jgi:hypothetical protein